MLLAFLLHAVDRAAAFVPGWSGSAGTWDLRQKATSIQVNDSTAMTFRAQLMEGGTADYTEVNLGALRPASCAEN